MHSGTVIWHFAIHWAHWAIKMVSKEFKISKLGADVITSDTTLTITGTHKNFRKSTSATSHSVIMPA